MTKKPLPPKADECCHPMEVLLIFVGFFTLLIGSIYLLFSVGSYFHELNHKVARSERILDDLERCDHKFLLSNTNDYLNCIYTIDK